MRAFRFAFLGFVALVVALPTAAREASGSDLQTVTRVLVIHRDGPVAAVPVELIDARTGVTLAEAVTDRRGVATFRGQPTGALVEAQIPSGHSTTQAFEVGSRAVMDLVTDQGPWIGVALSVGGQFGNLVGEVTATENTDERFDPFVDDGDGAFASAVIRGRVIGPELGRVRVRPFIEAGVIPAGYVDDDPVSSAPEDRLTGDSEIHDLVQWERELAWDIAVGASIPFDLAGLRSQAEFSVGFHQQQVDSKIFDVPNLGGPRLPNQKLSDSGDTIDSLKVGFAVPVELWRRNHWTSLLEAGFAAHIPLGDDLEVVTTGPPDFPERERTHVYDPKTTFVGHVALRIQFDATNLPVFE